MKKNYHFLILGLLLLLICGCQKSEFLASGTINCNQLKKVSSYENAKIIDVRTKEEYDEKHLDNAINIPYEQIIDVLNTYDGITLDTPIVVYCRSGARSSEAFNNLKSAGYKHIYDLGAMANCIK